MRQVFAAVDALGFVTAFKNGASPPVLLVEVFTITRHDAAHELTQRLGILCLVNKHVDVIAHKTVTEQFDALVVVGIGYARFANGCLGRQIALKKAAKMLVIGTAQKDGLLVGASAKDVVVGFRSVVFEGILLRHNINISKLT
jgi:hypothetical protein